jgi:hypothetical protein
MKIKAVFRWPGTSFLSKRLYATEKLLLFLSERRFAKRTPKFLRARGQAGLKIEGRVKDVCYLRRVPERYLLYGSILGRVNTRPRI